MNSLAAHYIDEARRQFRGHQRLGEGALAQLTEDQLFVTLDPESNSVAVVIKHLTGNMRSRFTDFLSNHSGKPDRQRDQEFELTTNPKRADIIQWWEQGWACVFAALDSLTPEDVMRTVYIRNEPHTVLQAINRQLAHYAYHVG